MPKTASGTAASGSGGTPAAMFVFAQPPEARVSMSLRYAMYVDGYNFYYDIKHHPATTQIALGWCDFGKLARNEIIADRGQLVRIKYFTAEVENFGSPNGELGGERARQARWLKAVSTIDQIEIIYGFHIGKGEIEPHRRPAKRNEKMTDVNIAIALVLDAARQLYDRAILISGDYDQMPAIAAVRREFPRCGVEVWLPPNHEIGRWAEFATKHKIEVHRVKKEMLRRSRLPDTIRSHNEIIEAPASWRLSK